MICKTCGQDKPSKMFAAYKRNGQTKHLLSCRQCQKESKGKRASIPNELKLKSIAFRLPKWMVDKLRKEENQAELVRRLLQEHYKI